MVNSALIRRESGGVRLRPIAASGARRARRATNSGAAAGQLETNSQFTRSGSCVQLS